MLLAAIMGSATLYLRSNIFITGLATNLLASGLTVVLSYRMFGNKGVVVFKGIKELPYLKIPPLQSIPILGDLLIGHHLYLSCSTIGSPLPSTTPFGLRLRSIGTTKRCSSLLVTNQISIGWLLSYCVLVFLWGNLSLSLGAFVPNMTRGRGGLP